MWVESLKLDNIKCFENQTINLSKNGSPVKWVTFISENGGGKSTALQALALLLAGPESVHELLSRPQSWLKDETSTGLISTRIHQDSNDSGNFVDTKMRKEFRYSFNVTGSKPLIIRKERFSEPSIQPNSDKILTWLRQNAFASDSSGWFAVGYGAFRRLTRSSEMIVPTLQPQARFTNFITQFHEDDALTAFERWMVHLDYRIAKSNDKQAQRQKKLGIEAGTIFSKRSKS